MCLRSGSKAGSTAIADKLVLALPFRILREVDIAPSIWDALTPQKRLAISRNPMGTNAKIHLELSHRTWGPDFPQFIQGQERILNGACYSDPADFQCVWDDSVRVEEGRVILLNYPGGTLGAGFRGNDPFRNAGSKFFRCSRFSSGLAVTKKRPNGGPFARNDSDDGSDDGRSQKNTF